MKVSLAACCLMILACTSIGAREINAMSYEKMRETSDAVITATVTKIEEHKYDFATDEHWKDFTEYGEPGQQVLKLLVAEKVSLRVEAKWKGDPPEEISVLNFRFKREPDVLENPPHFAELKKGQQYLVFVKKGEKLWMPVTGMRDPAYSYRKLSVPREGKVGEE
jgi:hypothetical protein